MNKSTVVATLSASVILGGSLIYSAMVMQGLVMNSQPSNIITTADGHVNLGKVYAERRLMDIDLEVQNDNGITGSILTLKGVNPDDFEGDLQDKLQVLADDTNKSLGYSADDKRRLQPDNLSVKKDSKLTITTYVKYDAQNIPSFTLNIMAKKLTMPLGTSIHNFVLSSATEVATASKPDLNRSMMIKDNSSSGK
jgi:hypothetical protein